MVGNMLTERTCLSIDVAKTTRFMCNVRNVPQNEATSHSYLGGETLMVCITEMSV